MEPPDAEEEAEARARMRPRLPEKGPLWARRAEQIAARCPARRLAGSRAHNRAHRGKDMEAAGTTRVWLEQPGKAAEGSDAQLSAYCPERPRLSRGLPRKTPDQ